MTGLLTQDPPRKGVIRANLIIRRIAGFTLPNMNARKL